MDSSYLIVVDIHSKWPEVMTTTADKTIVELRKIFSTHGLPEQIVSDVFGQFIRENGIKHIRPAPYHPSTNGEAERFVQTFKNAAKNDTGSLDTKLAGF